MLKPPLPRHSRTGFSLMELVVVLAILGIIGGVIVAQVLPRIQGGQAAVLARNLDGLADAIASFRGNVGRYPSQLTYLTERPAAGTAVDLCGRSIPAQFLDEWRGPYIQRGITAAGVPVGDATIQNALARDPPSITGGAFGVLLIQVVDVDREIADELEEAFDGNANLTADMIRWSGTGRRGTLSFAIPVRGC